MVFCPATQAQGLSFFEWKNDQGAPVSHLVSTHCGGTAACTERQVIPTSSALKPGMYRIDTTVSSEAELERWYTMSSQHPGTLTKEQPLCKSCHNAKWPKYLALDEQGVLGTNTGYYHGAPSPHKTLTSFLAWKCAETGLCCDISNLNTALSDPANEITKNLARQRPLYYCLCVRQCAPVCHHCGYQHTVKHRSVQDLVFIVDNNMGFYCDTALLGEQ